MNPTTYTNPPIVEAVVELRLDLSVPWSESLLAAVLNRLRPTYPGKPSRQSQYQVQAHLDGDELATAGQVRFHQEMLPSSDGKALVGVGEGLLSVHVLAPYPGWAEFFSRVEQAVAIYSEEVASARLSQIAVRYIDDIIIPNTPNLNVLEYFTCLPLRPKSMPETLEGFHVVTQTRNVTENIVAALTIASAPSSREGSLSVLYDLNMARIFTTPVSLSELREHAELLHTKQRNIFEDSITDNTRRLFS